jgi:hypothetical protein
MESITLIDPARIDDRGSMSDMAILQQLLWEIVRLRYQPASNLYRFSPKALDSAGHRVSAI